MQRIQSSSSINTFRQCPRKYYYRYIEKLPTKKNIHLIRGGATHTTLEDFFDIDSSITDVDSLRMHLFLLFDKHWASKHEELLELDMSERKIDGYYKETKEMLANWFRRFRKKLSASMKRGNSFRQAFEDLTPIREEHYLSKDHGVQGYMDVVFETDNNTIILDYKTSKKGELKEDYKLQLGIYALLYKDKKGLFPDFVGIDFLKHSEIVIPVQDKLVENAKEEIKIIHDKTTTENIEDYPMKPGPLCKWRTGQCDFYEKCFPNGR